MSAAATSTTSSSGQATNGAGGLSDAMEMSPAVTPRPTHMEDASDYSPVRAAAHPSTATAANQPITTTTNEPDEDEDDFGQPDPQLVDDGDDDEIVMEEEEQDEDEGNVDWGGTAGGSGSPDEAAAPINQPDGNGRIGASQTSYTTAASTTETTPLTTTTSTAATTTTTTASSSNSSTTTANSTTSGTSTGTANATLTPTAPPPAPTTAAKSEKTYKIAVKRLLSDFKQMDTDPPEGVSGAPLDMSAPFVWRCAVFGPSETVWEGGVFQLQMQFGADYPQKPPHVRFISKMFHPNVFPDGNLCLDIIQDKWSPVYSVSTILTSIQSLLSDPNAASPANPEAAKLFASKSDADKKEYRKRVRACVEKSTES